MYFFWITSFTSYSCGQKISRISSFCTASNCKCKGHTLLQLLQQVFCRMLTIILPRLNLATNEFPRMLTYIQRITMCSFLHHDTLHYFHFSLSIYCTVYCLLKLSVTSPFMTEFKFTLAT